MTEAVTYNQRFNLGQLVDANHDINNVLATHIRLYHQKQIDVLNEFGNKQLDISIEPHKSLYQAVQEGYEMSNFVIHFLNQSKKLLDEMQALIERESITKNMNLNNIVIAKE